MSLAGPKYVGSHYMYGIFERYQFGRLKNALNDWMASFKNPEEKQKIQKKKKSKEKTKPISQHTMRETEQISQQNVQLWFEKQLSKLREPIEARYQRVYFANDRFNWNSHKIQDRIGKAIGRDWAIDREVQKKRSWRLFTWIDHKIVVFCNGQQLEKSANGLALSVKGQENKAREGGAGRRKRDEKNCRAESFFFFSGLTTVHVWSG